ncbi:acyl carrier protein [candidate division WWE3 bacterium]|nr:acyl carrier protein [candidate division WWE3 bacterium]
MKEIFEALKNIISEKTGVEQDQIKPDSFFMDDLNIDEMELGEIITEFEDRLNIELNLKIEDVKTVSDLLHAVSEVTE